MSTTFTSIGERKVQLDNACVSIIVCNMLRCCIGVSQVHIILNLIHTHHRCWRIWKKYICQANEVSKIAHSIMGWDFTADEGISISQYVTC